MGKHTRTSDTPGTHDLRLRADTVIIPVEDSKVTIHVKKIDICVILDNCCTPPLMMDVNMTTDAVATTTHASVQTETTMGTTNVS